MSDASFSKAGFLSQKSRFLSQKLGLTQQSRGSAFPILSCLITCSVERCENHEPHPVLNPGFQKIIIPICRHSSYAQSASRKLRTRCQKARNGHCSSIHRLPTNSEGTVPVVKENFYKFDLSLSQQRHTFTPSQPLNLSTSLHLR